MNDSLVRNLACTTLLALCVSCQAGQQKPEEPNPDLASFVLGELPKDVGHETFIDFGGKVHLAGYDIEPEGLTRPGSKVKLTLYWRSNQRLGPGWGLFTHLDAPGLPSQNLDKAGPLRKLVSAPDGTERQALGPSFWQPGRIYVDELEFDLPKNIDAPEATVLAGIWREALPQEKKNEDDEEPDEKLLHPGLRLEVLSGPSDGAERGVVVHIPTGRDGRPRRASTDPAPRPQRGVPARR